MPNKIRSDGRYRSKIYLGNGKYKYIYAKTQKELKQKVAEARVALGRGTDLSTSNDTFGEWAERWVTLRKNELPFHSIHAYLSGLQRLEVINNRPITKIRAYDIQILFQQLYASGEASIDTLAKTKTAAKQVFDLAIANRVIDHNPMTLVKLPHTVEKRGTRRALTKEEIGWILAPTDHRAKTPAMIMLFAGLRRGEMMALTWDRIDLEAKTITVNKSVSIVNGRAVLKEGGKTENATRTIDIPDVLVEYLSGIEPKSGYVCPNTKGGVISPRCWDSMWDTYLKELNFRFGKFDTPPKRSRYARGHYIPNDLPFTIPRFTAHWLRHTYITLLYESGVDVLVAKEQAGHADIHTTLSIYTHLDKTHKRRQMDLLNDYLEENAKPSA